MAIRLVREPSETPNINNTDDFVGLRYAYGDNNGYVKGRGNECGYETNGLNFTIKSGRLVVNGVEVDIPSGGEMIAINMGAQYVASTIYLEVNLATNTAIIALTYRTSTTRPVGYPTVDGGDDLTTNTTGTARMELYHVLSLRASILEVKKLVKDIPYSGEALRGYDLTKGTIEERLDALGFKQGSVTLKSDTKYWSDSELNTDLTITTTSNSVTCVGTMLGQSVNASALVDISARQSGKPIVRKQGKYVIVDGIITISMASGESLAVNAGYLLTFCNFILSFNFSDDTIEGMKVGAVCYKVGSSNKENGYAQIARVPNTLNEITFDLSGGGYSSAYIYFNVGYETV